MGCQGQLGPGQQAGRKLGRDVGHADRQGGMWCKAGKAASSDEMWARQLGLAELLAWLLGSVCGRRKAGVRQGRTGGSQLGQDVGKDRVGWMVRADAG